MSFRFSLCSLRRAALAGVLGLGLTSGPVLAQQLDPATGEVLPAGAGLALAPIPADATAPALREGQTLTLIKHMADGETRGMTVRDGVLYRSNGGYFETVDVTDPMAPVVLDRVLVNTAVVHDVALDGDRAYVFAVRSPFPTGAGVYVVDISDPAALVLLGRAVGQAAFGGTARGNYVFAGAAGAGISVYDVSNPAAPQRITSLNVGGSVLKTALNENTLYASAGAGGFRVVDVSNPAAPVLVGSLATDGFATNVAYANGVAYVLVNNLGVVAVDVSNPASPTALGTHFISSSQVRGISIEGTTMYVTSQAGLVALDISNPAAMTVLGFVAFDNTGTGQSVVRVGDLAYVGHLYDGVEVFDVSTLATPQPVTLIRNGGFSFKVYLQGDLAYVSDLIGEYRIIDLSTPEAASIIGRVSTPPNTSNSTVRDGLAYVVDRTTEGPYGLTLVDVSDPTSPEILATYPTPGPSFGIDIVGETGYIANGNAGFLTMDLSAEPPVVLANFEHGNLAMDVRVRDDVAYFTMFGGGLGILDVSNPAVPAALSIGAVGGFTTSLALGNNNLLYLSEAQVGLRIVDVSNPASPVSVGTAPAAGSPAGVARASGYAYIADEGFGIRQYDVSNPTAPVQTFQMVSANRMVDVDVVGDLVVAADAGAGLYIFRVTGSTSAGEGATATGFTLDTYPNPFTGRTAVRYHLPEAGDVRVAVYSALGRRVATLVDGPQGAGRHEAVLDAQGLPAGVYFVRVEAAGQAQVRKVTLLR